MFRPVMFALAAVLAAGCAVKEDPGVKISSFGYDPEDSTRFIQAALDSGKPKLILDRQAGPWYTLPLKMRSNTELILEPGVELVAKRGEFRHIRDYLLELPYATNVVIRGGKGSTLRMWKKDYQKPPYKRGEWRYALRIYHCGNVLVDGLTIAESGGDGIGVTGNDIVIRNCVMDSNHRQGISVFSAENLLIENCVLANTSGTAPAAGIDFEPDRSGERLVNCVMRNCIVTNNHGHGIEIFLNNLRSTSRPVSLTFENCHMTGNAAGTHVSACGSKKTADFVAGLIRFVGCSFTGSNRPGILVEGLPDKAFDVEFVDCVISNACPVAGVDVNFGTSNRRQGVPDGITVKNLVIHQKTAREWFSYAPQGLGGSPRRISGDVTVCAPGVAPRKVVLDEEWIGRNMPVINGGRPIPERVGVPAADAVEIIDLKPGELVDLARITMISGVKTVFYAPCAGKVRFVARQVIRVAGRKCDEKPVTVTALGPGGKRGRTWEFARPRDKSTELVFDAPAPGFYAFEAAGGGTRFYLEKSSVPVAVNVSQGPQTVAPLHGNAFSLWVDAPAREFLMMTSGGTYNRFGAAFVDPSGKTVAQRGTVDTDFFVPASGKGLWRLDFKRAPVPNYDWIGIDLYGVPGFVFLTEGKRWKLK